MKIACLAPLSRSRRAGGRPSAATTWTIVPRTVRRNSRSRCLRSARDAPASTNG